MEPKNANCIATEVSQSVVSMSNMPRAVLDVSECSKESCSTVPTLQWHCLSMWGGDTNLRNNERITQNPVW